MSIVRTIHNRENPYVQINKNGLEDPTISWGAKGLWAYLLSKPSGWNVKVSHLTQVFGGRGGGRDAIYGLLKELIRAGYCKWTQVKEKGRVIGSFYDIYEVKEIIPQTPLPDADSADLINPTHSKEGVRVKNEETTTKKDVVVVSSEEKKNATERMNNVIKRNDFDWKIPIDIYDFVLDTYGAEYVFKQFEYLAKQHAKGIREEKANKKNPTPQIRDPGIMLKIACERNYAHYKRK